MALFTCFPIVIAGYVQNGIFWKQYQELEVNDWTYSGMIAWHTFFLYQERKHNYRLNALNNVLKDFDLSL